MSPPGHSMRRTVLEREAGLVSPLAANRRLHFTLDLAKKLCREATLQGHAGCVNRLAWSEDGCWLASGSDDKSMRIWRYPAAEERPLVVETHHQGNIFGVSFLPGTDNREVVSGAMDYTVQHHVMDAAPAAALRSGTTSGGPAHWHGAARSRSQQIVHCHTTLYAAHKGRIKDTEVAPGEPNVFWSASEDGTVRQFDKRCSTASQASQQSNNVLLQVSDGKGPVELKSVAVNKARPVQVAVAAGDSYLRVYDRRKLTLSGLSQLASTTTAALLTLAPPHLTVETADEKPSMPHPTYVQFGNRGDKVVATYHRDHAYVFDVTAAGIEPTAQLRPSVDGQLPAPSAALRANSNRLSSDWLSSEAEYQRGEGFQALISQHSSEAIHHYSYALRHAPNSALLYTQRAKALQQRGWFGDSLFALRDCDYALRCQPSHPDAMLLRAQALTALNQLEAATQAAERFEAVHPGEVQEEVAQLYQLIEDKFMDRDRKAAEDAARHNRRQACARADAAVGGGSSSSSSQHRVAPPSTDTGMSAADLPATAGDSDSEAAVQHPVWADSGDMSSEASYEQVLNETMNADAPCHSAQQQAGPAASNLETGSAHDSRMPHRSQGAAPSAACASMARSGVIEQDLWQTQSGRRLLQRCVGHCNCATDIKEAAFLGANDDLVACGSDDGPIFIYETASGEVVQLLQADEDVANCVQCHPHLPVLATSGIESVVRLWSPGNNPLQEDVTQAVQDNQQRMRKGAQLLRGVNPEILQAINNNPELLEALVQTADVNVLQVGESGNAEINCRMS